MWHMAVRQAQRSIAVRATGPRRPAVSRRFPSRTTARTYTSPRRRRGVDAPVAAVAGDVDDETIQDPSLKIRTMQYDAACLNTATLSGIVLQKPELREGRGGKKYATFELAVPKYLSSSDFDVFRVALFRFAAEQAAEHLEADSKIVVQGNLSIYGQSVSVAAADFALIEEESWPHAPYSPAAAKTPRSRTIVQSYLSPSQERVHADWTGGTSVKDIEKKRNLKTSTVLSYLAEAAFHGKEMDFEFLARKCLLGPQGSTLMKTDAVYAAIKEVMRQGGIDDLLDVPAAEVHSLLRTTENGQPFQAQEKTCSSVTYAQLKAVTAMMRQGVSPTEWNKYKVGKELAEPVY